ncbi:hypothetical protein HOP62_05050 [Halomonas sp. MCCC 1A17488]|uniref:Lipoprotein n=1 Tax=Billgrantia sulfidoxydans TaxID=2733484 RepID=A0ABX7W5A5_9GAMM|nr:MULTISPECIES: hypothetical protein [Halomonas]MCE8015442.1 hypothetical protein [Halomonas sp. MCCC 1A17488]MCG3238775.1 hypothetical protein [Halomonas sp. MCCC 1A17488]QPP51259.1 hypothetical protein I4484_09350 [Halomonas sp. SS10-MC5]QTP54817.1 hypothetical protein HNO51_09060 [Halomonas sulfidoxydans]
MKTSLRLLTLACVPLMLALAGCSYSPARITPEPLVVVDGSHRHYHGDGHRHRHHDRYVERHYYHDDRRYRDGRRYRDRYRHRGGFCPPGHAMKGNC